MRERAFLTQEIDRGPSGPKVGAFFDVDGTLLAGFSAMAFWRDRLRKAMPLLIPALQQDQVMVREGGHTWTVWSPAMGEVLRKADAKRD